MKDLMKVKTATRLAVSMAALLAAGCSNITQGEIRWAAGTIDMYPTKHCEGDTVGQAVCRAVIASVFGDTVEVSDE